MIEIRRDTVTLGFTVLAVMISLYLSTFQKGFAAIFPTILLLSGIGLLIYTQGKLPGAKDEVLSRKSLDIFYFTLIALAGISLGALLGEATLIPKTLGLGITGFDVKLYGVLMAVSEEVFFRGFVTNFLLWKMPNPMLAILMSGGVFTIFHLAVYETSMSTLLYVLIAGVILAYVAYRSRRLSPCILAHVFLNVAVM